MSDVVSCSVPRCDCNICGPVDQENDSERNVYTQQIPRSFVNATQTLHHRQVLQGLYESYADILIIRREFSMYEITSFLNDYDKVTTKYKLCSKEYRKGWATKCSMPLIKSSATGEIA